MALGGGTGRMTLWYSDSKASSNVKGNIHHLISPTEYNGFTTIIVANGEQMKITHTSFSQLSNGTHNFVLNDMFVIPMASKNLLFVYHFCLDNNIYIRDVDTKWIMMEGRQQNGLYDLPVKINRELHVLVGEKTTNDIWHCQHGHLHHRAIYEL